MRKLTALLLVLLLTVFSVSALAETTITVSGAGETLIPADTAVVSVGITARDTDALKAQSRANEVIANIREKLTEAGIPAEDINTGYVNLYAVYDYSGETETISAYTASSTLAVRVTDVSLAGKVIDLAFGAGANTLEGVSFSASDTDAARTESLKAAVADAKAKAEVLAAAAGLTIVRIDAIQEGTVYSYDSGTNNFSVRAVKDEAAAGAPTVVQAAKICVSANVSITFIATDN